MKIDLSCPIEMLSAQILQDGVGTLRLLNLSAKTIASVEVTVETTTGRGMHRVMDVNAAEGTRFELSIPAPETREGQEASGVVERVWFADASVWRRDMNATYTYTQNALAPGRALDELRFVAGQDAMCYPSEQEPLWVCVCGGVNSQERGLCRVCGRDRAGTFEHYNEEAVAAAVKRREEEMNEQAQKAVRESSEREQARALLERRRKRRRRIIALCVTVAVLAVAFSVFYALEGRNLFPYLRGQWLYGRGEYDKARDAFATLTDYRDAGQMAEDAEYGAALALTASDEKATVEEGIRRLEAIPNAQAIEAAAQARIALAARYESEGDYAQAEALLIEVANYPEAVEPLRRAGYQLALEERAQGDYAHAADRLKELDDYEDAQTLFIPCQYEAAKKAMDEEDYDEAIARFATVIDYEQSAEFTRECVYQIGLIMADHGEYLDAAAKFGMLGAYRDSADRALDAYYHAGLEAQEEGDFDAAISAYASAGDYLDARTRYNDCAMQVAQVHIDNAEYISAAELLATIEGSEEAHALWQKTVYTLAQMLWDEQDYGAAAERFASLGNYQDAAVLADQALLEQAAALRADGEYHMAIAIYETLGENYGAADLLAACRYDMAAAYEAAGEYADAQEAYSLLGSYKDAARRALSCGYALGSEQLAAGEYEAAYLAFTALTGYSDARDQAEAAADAWLGDVKAAADAAMAEEDYDRVIETVAPYVQKELPEKYAQLLKDYQEANYILASERIAADDLLGALPYLRAIPGYKNVNKLLESETYRLLGKWTTADGVLAQFLEDGTCIVEGEAGQYRVNGYSILLGAKEDSLSRAYSIISVSDEKLTLKRESDGATLRFTRQTE